jgi:hypothetical protein
VVAPVGTVTLPHSQIATTENGKTLNLSAEVESHEMKCISAGLAVQLAAC